MTSGSTNPGPTTPQAKLASKRWRYINSWWIFPPILSLGLLGWLGFLVAGVRTGKRMYWIFAGVYAVLFALFVTMIEIDPDGLISNIAVIPFLAAWIGPTVHAAAVNRRYLTVLAGKVDWYASPGQWPGEAQQQSEPFLGVAHSDYYGAPPAVDGPPPAVTPPEPAHPRLTYAQPSQASEPVPVNANTATVEGLTQLPGVGAALAQRVVAVRDARGGYEGIDDLASAANLQPHELVRLRDHLTFDQDKPASQRDNTKQHGSSGRILDI